ncbi:MULTISPECIES: nucleotidyltransferase family protein [Kordiimonas]|jgi:MurNAc alpha-1-phosphate uridylyltransferase|uniref:nucleotidyltransferase family protein n=1 Tax=Kordiimonas TaxID=288021 RepID=UPI00257CF4DE|nr:nucleotidyltransferase family protein [Kordiimonas sp. UBA4487]
MSAALNAMVLAAGKGTRMGALSDTTPKPLVPVAGVPLLDRILAHLDKAGCAKVVVNVHHLADQIEAHLAPHVEAGHVMISDERDALLETGGGVKKALPMLGRDPIYVINSDALWVDGDKGTLKRLATAFDPARMDVLLLLVPTADALGYDGAGDFIPAGDATEPTPITFRADAPSAPVMFGGIQVVKPTLYDDMPEGKWSNVEIFRKASSVGRLYGLLHTGHWMHVGTPEAIKAAEEKLAELGAD